MTDIQAILAILSTVITSIMGLLGLWMRDVLKQQRAHIEELNQRIDTLEGREREQATQLVKLVETNSMLRFRLSKALAELSKTNPTLAKALGETGEFKT
jgi:septal ring factor EnvC (AmiA/AmiB activator)